MHRIIKFKQKAWSKSYVETNADLRKKEKNNFEEDLFKLMRNAIFGVTMENVRKHRDIKLVSTERRRNHLVSKPNYHATKFFTEYLPAIEMKKTQMYMDKPAYLGLSILELSKIFMYEFCTTKMYMYEYVQPKYGEKSKLCYIDTYSFIVYIKTDNIYKNVAEDVETRFDTSTYELNRLLPEG